VLFLFIYLFGKMKVFYICVK